MASATRARLKRLLGPALPILRPARNRLRAAADGSVVQAARAGVDRTRFAAAAAIRAAAGRPEPPIRALRRHEFDVLVGRAPYYKPRWGYISVAGRIADGLVRKHGLHTALELGPHLRSTIVGADTMDLKLQPDLQAEGRAIVHDATSVPWPVEDKEYDLFVALQVFEHLGDGQAAAFREVRRIARHAVISLPIDWVMDDPANCHHGISNERALSWFAPVRPTRVEVGNPGRRTRLVYVFENLEA